MKSIPKPIAKPAVTRVPVAVKASGAKEVVLTGDFIRWTRNGVRLLPGKDGVWSTVLELAPGEYQYRLIVDGEWRDHAEASRRVANPFGTQNCVMTIP